jgi:hypothetical protein
MDAIGNREFFLFIILPIIIASIPAFLAIIFLPNGYRKVIALICIASVIFLPFIYAEYAAATFGFMPDVAVTMMFIIFSGTIAASSAIRLLWNRARKSRETDREAAVEALPRWSRADFIFYSLLAVIMPAFFIYFPFFARSSGKLTFFIFGSAALVLLLVFLSLKMLLSKRDWQFARRLAGTTAFAMAMLIGLSLGSGLWVQHNVRTEVRNEAYKLFGDEAILTQFWNLTILTMRASRPGFALNYSSDLNAKLVLKTTPEYQFRYWSWAHMRFIDINEVTFDERC